jgi:hypothetical protein
LLSHYRSTRNPRKTRWRRVIHPSSILPHQASHSHRKKLFYCISYHISPNLSRGPLQPQDQLVYDYTSIPPSHPSFLYFNSNSFSKQFFLNPGKGLFDKELRNKPPNWLRRAPRPFGLTPLWQPHLRHYHRARILRRNPITTDENLEKITWSPRKNHPGQRP